MANYNLSICFIFFQGHLGSARIEEERIWIWQRPDTGVLPSPLSPCLMHVLTSDLQTFSPFSYDGGGGGGGAGPPGPIRWACKGIQITGQPPLPLYTFYPTSPCSLAICHLLPRDMTVRLFDRQAPCPTGSVPEWLRFRQARLRRQKVRARVRHGARLALTVNGQILEPDWD
jgi:hypothetical protein